MFLTKGKYRNKKLLEMAKESPYCMNPTCGKDNNGDVVAAHLNFDINGNILFQADGNFTGSGHEFGQTGTQQIVWMDDNSTQVNIKKYDGSIIANPYLRLNIFYHTD